MRKALGNSISIQSDIPSEIIEHRAIYQNERKSDLVNCSDSTVWIFASAYGYVKTSCTDYGSKVNIYVHVSYRNNI